MAEIDRLPWETDEDVIGTDQPYNLHHDDVPDVQLDPIDNSLEMWLAVEAYHNMGLSVMWGRAEDDPVKKKKAKSPLISTWSSEIEARLSLDALSKMMHKEGAHIKIAPIVICGKGSGNLIVVDIDEKHFPGISARFLLAFRETYPDLYEKVRRHWTPSRGRHLWYRTEEHVHFPSKNPPLAFMKDSKRAGIESRTHGGYVLAPPGMGYEVDHDVPIPVISVADHEKIFALARLFDESVKLKAPPKTKTYDSIYDENPFEHFNSSPQAEYVLRDNGWDFDYENTQFTHWTRPGKGGGVSASWHKDKRFFHFFTTSTEIDTSKWNGNYSPANVRCILEFNGNWKAFYAVLAKEGFGRHKPGYEKKVIEQRKQTGKPLPANFSEEAKKELEQLILEKSEKYPYGTFWEFNINTENYVIQRQRLAVFMDNLGLRLHLGEPCVIEGQFIRKLHEDKKKNGARDVYNLIKSWIREEEEEVFLKISHEFSKFWQASGEFMVTTLPILDEKMILKSNPSITYKFFLNGILEITKDRHDLRDFQERPDHKIWAEEVIQREFRYIGPEEQKKSMYVDYLTKGISSPPEYVKLCMGYLCCEYKVSSESYMLALMEPGDASLGGGTGKGFSMKILSHWTSVLVTNGQAVKKDVDQLIQNWDGQRVVHLSDLPKWVNLSDLKHIVSDDSQRKLLYKDIQNIPVDMMPKFVLSGQFGLNVEDDGGVKRRVRQLSFSGYFSGHDSIRAEYGGDCPEVWDNDDRCELMGWEKGQGNDWNGYYSYLTDAIIAYKKVRSIPLVEDEDLWAKGFDMRFGGGDKYFRQAIEDKIPDWGRLDYVTVRQIVEWYEEICTVNNIAKNHRIMGPLRLHRALQEYGEKTGMYEYHYGDDRETIDGVRTRIVRIKNVKSDDGWGAVQDPGAEDDLPF